MSGSIPYIGSKISLITTSDIRYEGILYTLNREESTIAVQNVRSFGTEGRRIPEVPMSNEIYDFIIFRGKDLKDLTVLQGAPEPPQTFGGGCGGDYLDSSAQAAAAGMYNHPATPSVEAVGHHASAQMGSMGSTGYQQRPAGLGSAAPTRNGFSSQPVAVNHMQPMQPMQQASYSAGSVYPSTPGSSASRPSERTYSGGVPVRQPYASSEMQGTSLSPPPARQPLYEESNGVAPAPRATPEQVKAASTASREPPITVDQRAVLESKDQKAARGRGKGGTQKKPLYEVLKMHTRAQEIIVKAMRGQSSANLGPSDLRAMSEVTPSVYHFYLDFVNYCCPSHTIQSDEQQWEMLCKALKKHFEKEFGANQNQKPPQPQRPNNTLGDFITIETNSKTAKKNANKVTRGTGRVGRGTGRGEKKELGSQGSGDFDGPVVDESPAQSTNWVCPRCTLRNENLLLECAACGTSKQQAALWAEFPPLG